MSDKDREQDPVLMLLDELVKRLHESVATSIEVSADSFSVSVSRDASAPRAASAGSGDGDVPAADTARTQHVHATTVGIFSATRVWASGERVARGDVLGGIQSLGHIAEITSPADGVIEQVLVSPGAPVEYGQALFAITLV